MLRKDTSHVAIEQTLYYKISGIQNKMLYNDYLFMSDSFFPLVQDEPDHLRLFLLDILVIKSVIQYVNDIQKIKKINIQDYDIKQFISKEISITHTLKEIIEYLINNDKYSAGY